MTLQDVHVPHWRLQEQVPKSPAAPLSLHHNEPQPESAAAPAAPAAPRTTAPVVTRPDSPPRPDAPRIPSPSPTAVAAPHAPSPTAKDDHQHQHQHQHLLAAPAVPASTSNNAAPNSDSSLSSVTAQGGGGSGSFHTSSSSTAAGTSSEQPQQPTALPRVPGSATPTADGPPPALQNRELQQLQQPQKPPQVVPAPSPTSTADATNSAATSTSTSTSTPANATHSATEPATTTTTSPTTTTTTSIRSNFRDPIRWREPITVHYDSDSGHAHPGRIHAQPARPSSSAAATSPQLPPAAQLKYEPSRKHEEPPTSQPTTQSRSPTQAQSQSSAHAPPVQARQDRRYHYLPPSSQSHFQPPLQQAPAPVPAIRPPPVRSQRQSYEHHLQASQYQHQAPPSSHPQQHYQHSYLLAGPQHPPPPPLLSQQKYHPYESRYSARNDGLVSRPTIMDPPRSRPVSQPPPPAAPAVPSSGFPSPVTTHAHLNKKFVDDCTRLTYAIQQSTPDAVRRVFRDNWEKCMLGTEFHQAFILNASIHHAVPSITRRAVRDFGQKMVLESKHELISHFSKADLDEVADVIISKASEAFLDKCLAVRLETIEAKPLLTALARAQRLGYNPADIVEEQHERVMPTTQPARPAAPPAQPSYPGRLQCMGCFRVFTHQAPYQYHTSRQLCTVPPPATVKGFEFSCQHCGEGFTRSDEHQSHERAQYCFHAGPASARGPGRPPRAVPQPQPVPSSIVPSSQPQATPAVARTIDLTSAGSTPSAETPGVSKTPNAADPYGHLTQEQLAAMDADLQEAERKFAPRFAEAYKIPDENERRIKIEGLRNSFGTKQSMIRKKYGVRLRQRRTKAEIQAEEERMGVEKLKRQHKEEKKARKAVNAAAGAFGSMETAPPRPSGSSGWVAANAPRANVVWEEHEAKRRRMDASGTYSTPAKSTLSVSDMGGGLAGVAATAETHDPTRPPPENGNGHSEEDDENDDDDEEEEDDESGSGSPSTANDEMDVDQQQQPVPSRPDQQNSNYTNNNNHNDNDDDDDSDSSDDEDIPSTLPPHVRQTLATRNA